MAPPIPKSLTYLWGFFLELSRQRGSNGFGPSPLAYTDIYSWTKLTKIRLSGWEIDLILKLDSAYLSCINKHRKDS